jgi:uncharacterized spore protein YtfJ
MNFKDNFQEMFNTIQSNVHVKKVYGDPISAEGKTVIPVARVRYGFGGGIKPDNHSGSGTEEEKAEGGGGASATPLGVIEISKERTHFVPVASNRAMIGMMAAGFLLGSMLRRKKKEKVQ